MSGSALVDLMSMDGGLIYLVPVPPLAFVLLVVTLRWYSRNYDIADNVSAESSERSPKKKQAEDLKNFQLTCPTSPAGSGETCIICLEQMQGADPSCKLQCEHEFHPECLLAWCKSKAGRYKGAGRQEFSAVTCPTCRQKHKRHEVEQLGDEEMVHEVVWMAWQGFWTCHSIATPPTPVGSSLVLDMSLMAKIL